MNPNSANWSRAVEAVVNFSAPLGVPPTYGLEGCKAYDVGLHSFFTDCTVLPLPDHCSKSWCYVDEFVCRRKRMCEGDTVQPYCRDRPRMRTQTNCHTDFTILYSYETCGHLDTYTPERIHLESFNVTYVARALDARPWSYIDETTHLPTGIATDLESAAALVLQSEIIYVQNISEDSSGRFANDTWTACLHDIAIGVVDMCFGDYWVSKERVLLASFLPALYQDEFRLIAKTRSGETMLTVMEQPFLPFEWTLWITIICFLIFSGFILAFAEHEHNEEDFPDRAWWRGALKGMYVALMNFFAGGPVNVPQTPPGRVITMGIAFFVLIVLATYTANLASFLIAKQMDEPISGLEAALTKGLTVAIADVPFRMLVAEYPGLQEPGHHVKVAEGKEAEAIHAGLADVGIVAKSTLAKMYAGITVKADCEDPGATKDKDVCPVDNDDELDLSRDCDLRWVGEMLTSVNVAVPVAKKHLSAIAWATEDVLNQGYLPVLYDAYASGIPANQDHCAHATLVDEADRLPASALAGSLTVSGICVLAGLCGAFCGKSVTKVRSSSLDFLEQMSKDATPRADDEESGILVRGLAVESEAQGVQNEPKLQQAPMPDERKFFVQSQSDFMITQSTQTPREAQPTEERGILCRTDSDLTANASTQTPQASAFDVQTEGGFFTTQDTLSSSSYELRPRVQTQDDLSSMLKDLYTLTRRMEQLAPCSFPAQVPTPRPSASPRMLLQAPIEELQEEPPARIAAPSGRQVPKVTGDTNAEPAFLEESQRADEVPSAWREDPECLREHRRAEEARRSGDAKRAAEMRAVLRLAEEVRNHIKTKSPVASPRGIRANE